MNDMMYDPNNHIWFYIIVIIVIFFYWMIRKPIEKRRPRCPKCRSDEIMFDTKHKEYKCVNCGYIWK